MLRDESTPMPSAKRSEKPMAATLAQAQRMLAAAEKAGTLLMINWPSAWSAQWQELERRALAGDIAKRLNGRAIRVQGDPDMTDKPAQLLLVIRRNCFASSPTF